MEKITKVKDINITKLNNAEYRTFMARYGNLLAGGGGDSESPDEISFDPNDPLGIPQELRTAFATDFALLTDAVNQSSASEETAQMSALDKERDDLLIFITSTITQMTKSPLAAQRTAAEKLYLPVKPYIGAARLANLQETAAIEGLLVDLDKAGMPGGAGGDQPHRSSSSAEREEQAIRHAHRATRQRQGGRPRRERQENPPTHGRGIRRDVHLRLRAKRGEAHSRDRRLHQPPQRAGRRDERPLQPTHSAGEGRSRQETRRRQARYRQRLAIRDIK